MESVSAAVVAHAAPVPTNELGDLMRMAVERGDVVTMEKLIALKERIEDRNAAAEFTQALNHFQAECPLIQKKSVAEITSKSGGGYKYKFAELDQIARVTRPALVKHGFSYTWDSEVAGQILTCVCVLHHIGGHSRTAKFSCPTESASAMSSQQRHAAALTFAKRQSLVSVLGLTMTDADTDGASQETITEAQALVIEEWLGTFEKDDRGRFLAYMHVPSVGKILARDFDKALLACKTKAEGIAKAKKGGKP